MICCKLVQDQLFDRFGSEFRAKRDSLFTIDDARESNAIFVGSPDEAVYLSEIPGTTEFTLRRLDKGFERPRKAVVDSHQRPGAIESYARSYGENGIETNYAIVALKRGLDPSHWSMFLEGTSTVATQAAVDYVCNDRSVSALLNRLHVVKRDDLKPFEGLLRVRVQNDVPIDSELLDLRPTKN